MLYQESNAEAFNADSSGRQTAGNAAEKRVQCGTVLHVFSVPRSLCSLLNRIAYFIMHVWILYENSEVRRPIYMQNFQLEAAAC